MECPNCKQELQLNNPVEYNVRAYRKPLVGVALCCGVGVTVSAVTVLKASVYVGANMVDDWGYTIKPAVPA